MGCVAQLVEQRSPKSPVGGSNPSALDEVVELEEGKLETVNMIDNASTQRGQIMSDSLKKGAKSALGEIKEEIQKVAWPQADELKTCTKIVISATFVFGLGIYVSDLLIKGVLDSISMLSRVIFG